MARFFFRFFFRGPWRSEGGEKPLATAEVLAGPRCPDLLLPGALLPRLLLEAHDSDASGEVAKGGLIFLRPWSPLQVWKLQISGCLASFFLFFCGGLDTQFGLPFGIQQRFPWYPQEKRKPKWVSVFCVLELQPLKDRYPSGTES